MNERKFTFVEDERCRFRPINNGGIRVVVRLTMNCDLSCPHCLSKEQKVYHELSTEDWLALIKQFPDIGTAKVLLTGGEPLLKTDIVKLVEALSRVGIKTDLNSNLQKMTPSLMKDLKKAGLSEISVSLEGTKEIHDQMHGRPGAYEQLIKAINWADEVNVRVDASCCITQENYSYMMDLIQDISLLPIRSLTFSRLLPIGHGYGNRKSVTQEQLKHCYRIIQDQIYKGPTIPIRATGLLGAPRPKDCGRGNSLIGITPDGHLLGCVLTSDNPIVQHPLTSRLYAEYEKLRRELSKKTYALCWQESKVDE